jgi:putative endonuclease
MSVSDRRRFVGALGEDLARRHLEARGLQVIDTNFRTRHGELDAVAADDRCLVFCEVKTRVVAGPPGGDIGPFAAIGTGKRRQVRAMAREWLALHGREAPWREELRFDAIGIELDPRGKLIRLEHLEGAF